MAAGIKLQRDCTAYLDKCDGGRIKRGTLKHGTLLLTTNLWIQKGYEAGSLGRSAQKVEIAIYGIMARMEISDAPSLPIKPSFLALKCIGNLSDGSSVLADTKQTYHYDRAYYYKSEGDPEQVQKYVSSVFDIVEDVRIVRKRGLSSGLPDDSKVQEIVPTYFPNYKKIRVLTSSLKSPS